jgi:flavin reductase (DIM6/NTAB) family NADH-FMN oxidoreductase RutF
MKAEEIVDKFRASLRLAAGSVSLVTACDEGGMCYGMAVTSATSLSMDPPSMLVAINRSASIHPVIKRTGRFCLNLMAEAQASLLESFSRSDMRDKRFLPENWEKTRSGLPALRGALSVHSCRVEGDHIYGTHTVFFGRVEEVVLPDIATQSQVPIVWMSGARVSISTSCT